MTEQIINEVTKEATEGALGLLKSTNTLQKVGGTVIVSLACVGAGVIGKKVVGTVKKQVKKLSKKEEKIIDVEAEEVED